MTRERNLGMLHFSVIARLTASAAAGYNRKANQTQEGPLAQKYFATAARVRGNQRSTVIMADDHGHAAELFHERRSRNPALRELHHSVRRGERALVLSVA